MFDTRCFLQSRGDFTLPPPSVANPSLPPTTKEENYTGLTINHAKSAPQRQLQEQGGERNQTEHLCLGAQGHRRRRRHQLVHTGQGAQRVQPCHKAVKCSQAADTKLDYHYARGQMDECFQVYLFSHFILVQQCCGSFGLVQLCSYVCLMRAKA